MSFVDTVVKFFEPQQSSEFLPLRIMSVAAGAIGAITAVAGAIFGTLSTAASIVLAALSAALIVGGALGSIGLIALPIVVGLGIAFATPVAYGGYAVVIY